MEVTSVHPAWLICASLALAMLPVVVGICTSYLKVSIVLGMLRSGIGAQQVPSNLLIMALSTTLSFYIMGPVISRSVDAARSIDIKVSKLPSKETFERYREVFLPWRKFMEAHAGRRELLALSEEANTEGNKDLVTLQEEASLKILFTAFMLTELKEAFSMGFVILLPFLVIDLIVANVLAGMGMFMVSPTLISLPLKLLLFVVSDGWLLLSKSLILSYQ